jgi:Endonuclease NucS
VPLDIGLWRLDEGSQRIYSSVMPSERRLEDLIEEDLSILGQPLMLIGRQVPTTHGKFVDLLALDGDGALHVLELKRDRTPREVVAQALDYGSWVQELSHENVISIYSRYRPSVALEVSFEEAFGIPIPEELNSGHFLAIVAGDLDSESERIVNYLADVYEVPINVVFFRYFTDCGREYVARTWLREQLPDVGSKIGGASRQKESWNGRDWYLSFGESEGGRNWEDARNYGFVSAGGGEWYSRSLRSVPANARVWACIPKIGYVGVGIVTGPPQRFRDSRFADVPDLRGNYIHANKEDEWMLPVKWIQSVPKDRALWQKGMFANQNTGARLRNAFTLEILHAAFPDASD